MAGHDYLAPYQNKRLNEVVIVGAHDAGVYTANASNVQTQALNIEAQAYSGCRFFDIRIAMDKTKVAGQSVYTHKAYHLNNSLVGNSSVKDRGNIKTHQQVGHLGGWGGGLVEMLNDAAHFVEGNATEFIILKFSKCYNWASVAETCIATLGDWHYKEGGNLNNKTVGELSGKVITVFDEESRGELTPVITAQRGSPHGIMFIKALYDKKTGKSKTYDASYWGMQYFGKFSSTDDISKNTKKQGKTLVGGAATHIDAMGMMYWTTTAMTQSIQKRNDQMWTKTNVGALRQTWQNGLESAISSRFGSELEIAERLMKTGNATNGQRLKAFMPNIVMMDFIDPLKCRTVGELNTVAATSLQKLMLP